LEKCVREYSVPALAGIPSTASLADMVRRRATEQPHVVALRRKNADGTWQDVTASQFRDEVYAVAAGLMAAGIQPGDRVALMSRTRYEWTLLDYALLTAGAVVVPIYETSSAEQAEWILSDSAARAVFVETEGFEQLVTQARGQLSELEHVWRIEPAIKELTADGASVSGGEVAERARSRKASDLATLIYTSGTTGRPKGCQLSHENLLSDARNAFAGPLAEFISVPGASSLLFLPLAHSFARIIQVGTLEAGITLGHCPDMNDLLPDLASFQPTFVLAVPRVFEKVYNGAEQKAIAGGKGTIFARAARVAVSYSEALDGPGGPAIGLRLAHMVFDRLVYGKLRAALGGKARYCISGGAALSPRLGHFFRGAGVTVLEGYGLTETSPAAAVNRPGRQKIGSVGQPLPGVAIRIAEDGEVQIKGTIVFSGYWRNDEATAASFSEDGWYCTGDLGELDDEGFLTITGRKKEIIVTAGGKNVAPAILEDRMRGHALISQCMVVGDGRPYIGVLVTIDPEVIGPWKERHGKPAAATVGDLRTDPDLLAEIQAAVDDANKVVSRAESIRRFRILDRDFTQDDGHLSAKLSLKRQVVAKDFAADIEALYS
jgi:long-chain acyl-CoA synthetase